MNFAGLKAAVQANMGARTDIPAHVYEVTLAEINRDVRITDMEATATITADAESESLPADFLEVVSVHYDSGGVRFRLKPTSPDAINMHRSGSGRPRYYAVVNGALLLGPDPDGSYSVTLRYYAKNGALSADEDVNPVLTKYPGLYLACAMKHAKSWVSHMEGLQAWSALYDRALADVRRAERRERNGGPITPRMQRYMGRWS